MPSGSLWSSISEVSSHTAAPSRGSPSWCRAGSQTSSMPTASKMAAVTWAFERAVTKNADVALPAGAEEPLGAPRRVGPHDDGSGRRATGVVTDVVTERDLPRAAGRRRASRTLTWSATVLAPALPGRKQPRERLAGGIGEAEHRVEAAAALVVGPRASLVSVWISTSEASMSRITGRLPVVADERRQTSARTSANASAMPRLLVEG